MEKYERLHDYISWRNEKGEFPSIRSLKQIHHEFINKDTDNLTKISQREIEPILKELCNKKMINKVHLKNKKNLNYVGYQAVIVELFKE